MLLRLTQKQRLLISCSAALFAVAALSACDSKRADQPASGESRGPWTYSLHLGDSRENAHKVLGNATRTTEELEEYPLSGVTLWLSPEGRVTKFNFQGAAGVLYSDGQTWIPSDRTVVFGLTAQSSDADFAGRLGEAVFRRGGDEVSVG